MTYRSDDGLGAAYGLWEAMKIVGGGFLLFWWVYGTLQTLKAGNWETWLVASGSLAFCVLTFHKFTTNYPKDRFTAAFFTVVWLVLFFRFI